MRYGGKSSIDFQGRVLWGLFLKLMCDLTGVTESLSSPTPPPRFEPSMDNDTPHGEDDTTLPARVLLTKRTKDLDLGFVATVVRTPTHNRRASRTVMVHEQVLSSRCPRARVSHVDHVCRLLCSLLALDQADHGRCLRRRELI